MYYSALIMLKDLKESPTFQGKHMFNELVIAGCVIKAIPVEEDRNVSRLIMSKKPKIHFTNE